MTAALRVSGLLASSALLLWIAFRMAGSADGVAWHALRLRPAPLLGSGLLLATAYLLRGAIYVLLLRRVDAGVSAASALEIFFASQAGRYLTGKVWQIAGAGLLARLRGVSASAAAQSALSVVLLHHLAGAVTALLAVRRLDGAALGLTLLVGGGALAVLLAPALLADTLRRIARLAGRDPGEIPAVSRRRLLALTPAFVSIWLLFGGALALLAEATLPAPASLSPFDATGVMAASCVAGYVVLIAPAGLGVREATMVLLLSPTYGTALAGLLALAMRVWMTAIEMVFIVWGLAGAWLRGRGAELPRA